MRFNNPRDSEEFEYGRVMVKRDSKIWSVRKMNYHVIEEVSTKKEAIATANKVARFVTVRE